MIPAWHLEIVCGEVVWAQESTYWCARTAQTCGIISVNGTRYRGEEGTAWLYLKFRWSVCDTLLLQS